MTEELRLSVSKTKTFLDCKKKFEFVYVQKLPRKEFEYHTFGKFCHKVLEDFHLTYINGNIAIPYNTAMSQAFKNAWEEYKEKMTLSMKKECWELINQYLKIVTSDKKNNLSANVIACEKNFNLPVGENIILNGMIDRVQIDDDDMLHLADYKTTKNKKYLKDDWFQLMTYGFVMLHENPDLKKIRVSYILLRHNFEYVTKEFSADELMKIKDKYIDYAEQIITEKEFPPNPTILCNYCEYLEFCPEGKTKSFGKNIYGEVAW